VIDAARVGAVKTDDLAQQYRLAVAAAPDLRERLSIEAVEPLAMSPEKFLQFIKADIARWTKVAKERNISLDS
jgi:tripartite-type tricarboxylate transporter receptor subunit TctC